MNDFCAKSFLERKSPNWVYPFWLIPGMLMTRSEHCKSLAKLSYISRFVNVPWFVKINQAVAGKCIRVFLNFNLWFIKT